MSTPAAFLAIQDNLNLLDDWEDRYRYLIELGQGLPDLAASERTPENKVRGCMSQVWLVSGSEDRDGQTVMTFRGDSDAMIVKGLVAVLVALYSGRPSREIAETDAIEVFDGLGLREHLSTQRSNGLIAMVNRVRSEARALTH